MSVKEKSKGLLAEFKTFALKGNVIDMAVGVMIGSAFGKIVTSIVNDLFMPLITLLTGRINFSSLGIKLGEGEDAAVFAYGNFLQTVVDFLLMAICVFIFVKLINALHKKPAEAPKEPPRLCPYCRMEIAKDATRCPHCTSELK
jgi:large conductance mechanosensitive channel